MKMRKLLSRCPFGVVAVVAAVALVASPSRAQSYEYEWGRSLMEDFRFDDMAEGVFTDLIAESDKEQKNLGFKGMAKLKRRQAQRTTDVKERAKLNEEALKMFEQVSKNLKKGTILYYETRFELADTLQEVAAEDIDLLERGLVPADAIEALRKNNMNRLNKAESIYASAAGAFADVDREKDNKKWFMARSGELNQQILLLRKAELIGTDKKKLRSPKRVGLLSDAIQNLDEFVLEYESELIGLNAMMWYGRVKAALLESEEPGYTPDDVAEAYWAVYTTLILSKEELGADWGPASPIFRDLAQRACWWLFQFENKVGRSTQCITAGERFRQDWADGSYEYSLFGRLALAELGRAFHVEGRSSEALALAAEVSAKGGYPGQEADKLMSLIIDTAPNKEQFPPEILAAGANGAYVAGFKNPDKFLEAVTLYQMVLANLPLITDELERNDLGRNAWYKIGVCYDKLGRSLEAATALENGYRRFNNSKGRTDPKRNGLVAKYWRAVINDLIKADSGNAYFKSMLSRVTDQLIKSPPITVGGPDDQTTGVGIVRLQWQKAQGLLRQREYPGALKEFEAIALKVSEYQERAMVKVATINLTITRQNKAAAPKDYVAAAARFETYKNYTDSKPESDAQRLRARRGAILEADFQISECYARAAKLETVAGAKNGFHEKVLEVTQGFEDRTKDKNLRQHARYNRFKALMGLIRIDDAETVFQAMLASDPKHKLIVPAAQSLGGALRAAFGKMPTKTEAEEETRDAVKFRCAQVYRVWLEGKNPNKAGYWTLVYKMYYDLAKWQSAYDLLTASIEKFEGTRKVKEKDIKSMRRRQAKCLLELAKIAYAAEDRPKTDDYFNRAAAVYKVLVGPDNKAPTSVLEEAAQIFGGFLSGPNNRGAYVLYPGTAEFKRSRDIWFSVEKKMRARVAKDAAEERVNREKEQTAKFHKMLMEYRRAKVEGSTKALEKLKRALAAMKQKNPRPGGKNHYKKYEWLASQVR